MNNISIFPYKPGDETFINRLIREVYDEFVATDYSDAGNMFFYDWIEPSKIAQRQRIGRTIWIARDGDKMVGVIEIRDNKYISLLFVLKEYQGRGIAKNLFITALKNCQLKDPELKIFHVHASPYSIPIYEKLGFRSAGKMLEEHGIKYLPMEMAISESSI